MYYTCWLVLFHIYYIGHSDSRPSRAMMYIRRIIALLFIIRETKYTMENIGEEPLTVNNGLSYITSNKEQPFLVMNQSVYKSDKKTPNKKRWICIVKDCNVYVYTDISNKYLFGDTNGHSHPANPKFLQIKQTRMQI